MALAKVKTEHAGAKNGGGAWDTRANAKKASNKRRRAADREFDRLDSTTRLGATMVRATRNARGSWDR